MGEQRYMTLMASLPYHGRLFGARQTPLSRFQLDKRLAWLDPVHRQTLAGIESVLRWRTMLMKISDREFLDRADTVVSELDNELLVDVVTRRLEMRTVAAALRMRHAGRAAPGEAEAWGFGRWVRTIRAHWTETGFNLERVFPWVTEAARLTEERDALGLERLLMQQAWEHLSRSGADHYFDFEAVTVYVLRWDLVERWTRQDGAEAKVRFGTLADQGQAGYQTLFH